MSNKGLRIKAHLLQGNKGLLVWNLNCFDERSPGEGIGIALENYDGVIWARAIPRQLVVIDHGWISMSEETLFTSKQLDSNVSGTVDLSKQWSSEFRDDLNNEVYRHIKTESRRYWDSTRSGFITTGVASFTACLTFQSAWATDDRTFIIACGLPDFQRTNGAQQGPWVCIFTHSSIFSHSIQCGSSR
ncbi:HET domain-containing protein [Seiridium cupressi]